MSATEVRRLMPASPERVFLALADPRTLHQFVVGTRTIRRFDPRWPDPGTRVHHSVGLGPFVLRDSTEVVSAEPPGRLLLRANIGPLGALAVDFRLEDAAEGTELTVDERVVAGPFANGPLAALVNRLLKVRNLETLRRLRRLVERREVQRIAAQR